MVHDPAKIRRNFDRRWEAHGVKNFFFGASANGMYMTNSFWCMRSPYFPQEYAKRFVENWALDKEKGTTASFFLWLWRSSRWKPSQRRSIIPLVTLGHRLFYIRRYVCSGFGCAPELTINHLENYNYREEWGSP